MFNSDYKWQHDYVRLATDTGFCFERHKSDSFDRNKIYLIDINRLIEERDFATVEKLIPSITKFVLDPEQAQILDENFVKTFRLSQLSIQYLSYCKKYLDNTLAIIKEEIKKLKEENKELNLFVDDLKEHISTLMRQLDEKPTFKCDQCTKVFSSEEFLSSHIKRRHSAPLFEEDTNKLQMEIKELKGRLNNAEKIIQKEQVEENTKLSQETEAKRFEELQQKFEDLRVQVQSELKVLQTQHNFQDKYEKWFEKMALERGAKNSGDLGRRRESTTQTDLEGASKEFEVCKFDEKDKENVPEFSNTQKQITEFGEALETKVTSSLDKIEKQMKSFWDKLNEMELHREEYVEQDSKPVIKPRSRYTVRNLSLGDVDEEFSPKRDTVKAKKYTETDEESVQETKPSPKHGITKNPKFTKVSKNVQSVKEVRAPDQAIKTFKVNKIESGIHLTDLGDETTTSETLVSDAEITVDSPKEEVKPAPKPLPVPRKRPLSSSGKKSDNSNVIDEELLEHFSNEIEKIIMGRLQDLGVSPDWKGLPTRSFQRAMEIVNHQANLTKKSYPNFDFISAQIEKNVTKKVEDSKTKRLYQKKPVKAKPKKVEEKKIKINTREKIPSPSLEIKNRKMYDTDSESDVRPIQIKENLKQFSAPYSAVIEELKAVTTKIEASDKSDLNSVREEVVKTEDQTKGVLKSYPSVGSLTKKKVLFNLDVGEENKKDLSAKDGGSTTSITSSVFDGTPRKDATKKEKDIEDLSDFDFSDM